MNVETIDNSIENDLRKVISWQFDNATHLVGIVQMLIDFYDQSTKELWNKISSGIGIADPNVDDFDLSRWGKLLGISRPVITYEEEPVQRTMSKELYRLIILGRVRLLHSNASIDSYLSYVKLVFGNDVRIDYRMDMSIGFTYTKQGDLTDSDLEKKLAIEQFPELILAYPSGVKDNIIPLGPILGFDGQEPIDDKDPIIETLDNVSFTWM